MSNQSAAQPSSPARAANAASAPQWATNATFDQFAADLRRARTVVVTTHAKPDGDAAGSTLAMARALKHAGVAAEIWYAGPLPRWVPDLCASTPFRTFAPGQPMQVADGRPAPALDADLCVIVDTGSWTQLAEMRPWLEPRADRNINLDHHLHGDGAAAARRIIDSTCASCTQVIAPLCVKLCAVPSAAKLPLDVAEPLYLGLATDTGWFRYSSVTPATLRLAADLIEAGVDHTKLYGMIEQQDVASRWRLLGRALNTLELHSVRTPDDAATMSLTLADFDATGADRNDTAGLPTWCSRSRACRSPRCSPRIP